MTITFAPGDAGEAISIARFSGDGGVASEFDDLAASFRCKTGAALR